MCIKHVTKYAQCGHTGVKLEHCDIYNANPKACRGTEKYPETINDLCRKCGGGPQQKPVIEYVDPETFSFSSREPAVVPDTPSRLDSSVELVRKGNQKAIDGMKRLIRSARSSGGSSTLVDTVSEIETLGENAASYPSMNEILTESKTMIAPSSRAKPWQKITGSSSDAIRLRSNTSGSAHIIRPSAGRDMETASVVTTWTRIMSKSGGLPDPGRVEVEQVDKILYEKKGEVPQINKVVHPRRLEELAQADERLAKVRDGRGHINFNVV